MEIYFQSSSVQSHGGLFFHLTRIMFTRWTGHPNSDEVDLRFAKVRAIPPVTRQLGRYQRVLAMLISSFGMAIFVRVVECRESIDAENDIRSVALYEPLSRMCPLRRATARANSVIRRALAAFSR